MLKDWVNYELSKGGIKWGTANPGIKSKVKMDMKYMETLATPDEQATIDGKPARNDCWYVG